MEASDIDKLKDELRALLPLATQEALAYMLLAEDVHTKKLDDAQKLAVIAASKQMVQQALAYFSPWIQAHTPEGALDVWSELAVRAIRELLMGWLYSQDVRVNYDTSLRPGYGRLMYAQTTLSDTGQLTIHIYPELLAFKQQKLSGLGWARSTLQLEVQTLLHECFHVWEERELNGQLPIGPLYVRTWGIRRPVKLDVVSELGAHAFAQSTTHYAYAPPFDDFALLVASGARDVSQLVAQIMKASELTRSM